MNWLCMFGHSGEWQRGRNAQGQAVKLCERCQQPLGVLLVGEMITTPLSQSDAGAVTTKAQRVTRANVSPMRRSER